MRKFLIPNSLLICLVFSVGEVETFGPIRNAKTARRRISPLFRRKLEPLPIECRPTATGTALFAGVKFKNLEEMLASFNHDELILLIFTAMNCGPCRLQKKELTTVRETIGRSIKMFAIDTEKWPHVGSRFDVDRLPCVVMLKDGEVLHRLEGFTNADELALRIRSLL